MTTRLPSAIIDLNLARPVDLALIDAVRTIDGGEGPWLAVNSVAPGVLLASKDPVAADAVATALMGFDPAADWPDAPFLRARNHLNLAYEQGLGTNRLNDMDVLGVPIEAVRLPFRGVPPVLRF